MGALVIIAAEQYASRLVVPSGQRMPVTRWSSHKDIAAKAIKKLAGPHVPATLTGLERAVKRAHAAYAKAETEAHERRRGERHAVEAEGDDEQDREFDADLDEGA